MVKKQQSQPYGKPAYRSWQALYLSFFSPKLYVDVAKRWSGYGFFYFFLMICLLVIPAYVRIAMDFNHYFEEQVMNPIKAIPPITIRDKQFVVDKPMPYVIKNQEGKTLVIIDTTGKINTITNHYPDLMILITKNKIDLRLPKLKISMFGTIPIAGDVQSLTLSAENNNEAFSGQEWIEKSHLGFLKWLCIFSMYPAFVFFPLGLFFLLMVAFVFLARVFAHVIFNMTLNFQVASRLLMVASTPVFTALFIAIATNKTIIGGNLIYVAILAVYFSYAILVVKRDRKKMVLS